MSNFFLVTVRNVVSPQHGKHQEAHIALNKALIENGYIGTSSLTHPMCCRKIRRSMS